MTRGNDTYEWSVEEIEALCRVAGVEFALGENPFGLWVAHVVNYNTGAYIYKIAESKTYAANAAWNNYIKENS